MPLTMNLWADPGLITPVVFCVFSGTQEFLSNATTNLYARFRSASLPDIVISSIHMVKTKLCSLHKLSNSTISFLIARVAKTGLAGEPWGRKPDSLSCELNVVRLVNNFAASAVKPRS